MSEIPFWFHDRQKWVSGISGRTTCQDVLQSLVRAARAKAKASSSSSVSSNRANRGNDEDVHATARQLVLVEQWRGVERPLAGTSRILKLWQAWGEERKQVQLVQYMELFLEPNYCEC